MANNSNKYWFKPKKFWIWCAAYYPVSLGGWAISLLGVLALVSAFLYADSKSHSVSDTLYGFVPWMLIIFILLDIATRVKGEYPSWWKRRKLKDIFR